jgi:hypothetical protein
MALLLQGGRLAADRSLADVSGATDIPEERLSGLERGTEALDVETLLALLADYDIPFSMFAIAFETATRAVRLQALSPPLAPPSYDSTLEPSAPV